MEQEGGKKKKFKINKDKNGRKYISVGKKRYYITNITNNYYGTKRKRSSTTFPKPPTAPNILTTQMLAIQQQLQSLMQENQRLRANPEIKAQEVINRAIAQAPAIAQQAAVANPAPQDRIIPPYVGDDHPDPFRPEEQPRIMEPNQVQPEIVDVPKQPNHHFPLVMPDRREAVAPTEEQYQTALDSKEEKIHVNDYEAPQPTEVYPVNVEQNDLDKKRLYMRAIYMWDDTLTRDDEMNIYRTIFAPGKTYEQAVNDVNSLGQSISLENAIIGAGYNPKDGMANTDINKVMKRYSSYIGCISSDQIDTLLPKVKPGVPFGFVMNTMPSTKEGLHWVSVYCDPIGTAKNSPSLEYFDSYADDIHHNMKQGLMDLAEKARVSPLMKFKENSVIHQTESSSTCGFHAMDFLMQRFKGVPFEKATGFVDYKTNKAKKYEAEIEKKMKQRPFNLI